MSPGKTLAAPVPSPKQDSNSKKRPSPDQTGGIAKRAKNPAQPVNRSKSNSGGKSNGENTGLSEGISKGNPKGNPNGKAKNNDGKTIPIPPIDQPDVVDDILNGGLEGQKVEGSNSKSNSNAPSQASSSPGSSSQETSSETKTVPDGEDSEGWTVFESKKNRLAREKSEREKAALGNAPPQAGVLGSGPVAAKNLSSRTIGTPQKTQAEEAKVASRKRIGEHSDSSIRKRLPYVLGGSKGNIKFTGYDVQLLSDSWRDAVKTFISTGSPTQKVRTFG